MLVLNTNLYYDQNKLTVDMADPADQFSWADRVLTEAANNKEKARHHVHQWSAAGVKLKKRQSHHSIVGCFRDFRYLQFYFLCFVVVA